MTAKNRSLISIVVLFISFQLITDNTYGQAETIADSVIVADELISPEIIDSLALIKAMDVGFNIDEAINYLSDWYDSDIWNDNDEPLREAIGRLLFEVTNQQLFRIEDYVNRYDWSKIKIPASSFFHWDTLHIIIPVRDIISENPLETLPEEVLVIDDVIFNSDSTLFNIGDSIPSGDQEAIPDTNLIVTERMAIQPRPVTKARDSIIIVISDTLREVISSNPDFPFKYYNYPMTGDSIQTAISMLMDFVADRDSSQIWFSGAQGSVPVWLKKASSPMKRLWLRNEWDEDVSVWIGSVSRDSVDIIIERGVHFTRLGKTTNIADARVDVNMVDDSKLIDIKKLEIKPQYWKFLSEASFVFNQTLLQNWVKGGESNISTLLDVTGTANYTNKEKKMVWKNLCRIKFGLIASTENGVRKNIDQLDIISKFNNKAFGKFDFSATMLFKTQLAYGYKYPNDSVPVSKFFNPASFTIGLGLDYKPNKYTSINFAPLSYKGTFVPDTVDIDQTKHGLKADQRSRHEPGMSAQINHTMTIWNDIKVVNKVRLFTNYIDDPLNIDIDWEMIATLKLNWFTDIRLNTHLIYDDDTLIPVKDENDEQVMNSDGTPKKVAMVQFRELIGLSIIFRF